jgi:hypothetical protein
VTAPAAMVTYPEFEGGPWRHAGTAPTPQLISTAGTLQPRLELQLPRGSGRSFSFSILPARRACKRVALSHRAVLNVRLTGALSYAEDVIVSWLPLYHDMG